MLRSTIAFLLLASIAASAHAGVVSYATTGSQLCVGASGCGVAQQTIGGALTVQFQPVATSTVNVAGQSFASLGQLVVSCVGGGTACGDQSLAGLNLYINISQSAPSSGNGSISGGVISGSIRGTASNAVITWSVPNTVAIGAVTYAIANTPLALVPPSANSGVTTIQALITDPN
jgi:hypothetical protein